MRGNHAMLIGRRLAVKRRRSRWNEMGGTPGVGGVKWFLLTKTVACMTDGKNHKCLCGEALKLLKAAPVWQSKVHPRVNRKWEQRWCLIVISPDASTESSLRRKEWERLGCRAPQKKWGRFCHSWSPLTFWMKGCEGHKRLTLLSFLFSCPAFLCKPCMPSEHSSGAYSYPPCIFLCFLLFRKVL